MARARREKKTGGASAPSQGAPKREDAQRRPGDGNQGEGNREADRRYRQGVAEFERSGRVPKAADEARRSVEESERGARSDRARDVGAEDDDRPDDEAPRHDGRERPRPS